MLVMNLVDYLFISMNNLSVQKEYDLIDKNKCSML